MGLGLGHNSYHGFIQHLAAFAALRDAPKKASRQGAKSAEGGKRRRAVAPLSDLHCGYHDMNHPCLGANLTTVVDVPWRIPTPIALSAARVTGMLARWSKVPGRSISAVRARNCANPSSSGRIACAMDPCQLVRRDLDVWPFRDFWTDRSLVSKKLPKLWP